MNPLVVIEIIHIQAWQAIWVGEGFIGIVEGEEPTIAFSFLHR
jgi:hypothetical protein